MAKEIVIWFPKEQNGHGCYLQEEEKTYRLTTRPEYATIYLSEEEAQKTIDKLSFQDYLKRHSDCEIAEMPSKRLELEPDERIVFFAGVGRLPGKDKGLDSWEQLAVKEISCKEAAKALSLSMEAYCNPVLYCWDVNFYDGSLKTLYGVAPEYNEKFIVNHLMGGFTTILHCGQQRVINSGYRMPVRLPSGELRWVNSRGYVDLINEGMKREELVPAYETNLDLEAFYDRVNEAMG